MILEVDAGNTRIKWRIVDQSGGIVDFGIHVDSIEKLVESLASKKLQRARISSVRSPATNSGLELGIQRSLGIVPEFAQSTQECGGLTNGYLLAEQLGVDRWLAMLAGLRRSEGQAFVIVDAGSAITMDFVDRNGVHAGGYIVPGLRLQLECLSRGTAIAVRKGQHQPALVPGRDTNHAIKGGILAMVCHWIEFEINLRRTERLKVLITGGDAAVLAAELLRMGHNLDHVPDLVLDGLGVALP